MVVVGKLSSFRSSLVGKLLGYQEVVVHKCDEESTESSDQKDADRKIDGISDDIVKSSNEKLSLFDSGTVQSIFKNNSLS